MPYYETSVRIDAAAERVWKVLTDVEKWPELTPSMTSVAGEKGSTVAVGNSFLVKQPKLRPARWVVTDVREGTGFTWQAVSAGVVTRADHVLRTVDDGTLLTLTVVQTGFAARLVGLFAGGLTRRYITWEANGIKARSEE
jgi:ligand-binding SRPBCC domain-containing protein